MAYFNTTHLVGEDLQIEIDNAAKQDVIIMQLFLIVNKPMSPSQVWEAVDKKWPLTSIRRAMTNLTSDGKLVKSYNQVRGIYGKPEYLWRIPSEEEGIWEA